MKKKQGDRLGQEDINKCRLLISRSGVVDSQIFIRDSFKKRNETRVMINPILHLRVTETK